MQVPGSSPGILIQEICTWAENLCIKQSSDLYDCAGLGDTILFSPSPDKSISKSSMFWFTNLLESIHFSIPWNRDEAPMSPLSPPCPPHSCILQSALPPLYSYPSSPATSFTVLCWLRNGPEKPILPSGFWSKRLWSIHLDKHVRGTRWGYLCVCCGRPSSDLKTKAKASPRPGPMVFHKLMEWIDDFMN